MNRRALGLLCAAASVTVAAAAPTAASALGAPASGAVVAAAHADPVAHGVVRPRHEAGAPAAKNANMTYHGGKVMTTANITPIFWGTSWPTDTSDKRSGIDRFYAGWNLSSYAKTTTEYDANGVFVGATSTSKPAVVDGTAATGGNQTQPILDEVSRMVAAGKVTLDPSGNGYYPVYTDLPRGNAGYCAWHSSGTIGTTQVQFAFFFKLDGDTGCDPQDPSTAHSQGLEAIANVTAHELAEALTDPASPGAWYDQKGAENGDKCAWTFSGTQTLGTDKWKLQGEWSNKAFTAGTGTANGSGQKGCIWSAP